MTKQRLVYAIFVAVGLVLFVICTVGFGVHARIAIGGDSYEHALSEHLHGLEWFGSIFLLLPFAMLSVMAAAFFTRQSPTLGIAVLLAGAAILAFLYYNGYVSSQVAMIDRKWTAAALSVGLLPFQSIGALVVLLIAALIPSAIAKSRQ